MYVAGHVVSEVQGRSGSQQESEGLTGAEKPGIWNGCCNGMD